MPTKISFFTSGFIASVERQNVSFQKFILISGKLNIKKQRKFTPWSIEQFMEVQTQEHKGPKIRMI